MWTWPGCVRRRGRDLPHRRWQDRMRDKSIQCDWNCTRLVQEAACEDAVATYVDVVRFLFGEGGCTKQLARSKPHDGAGFYVQKV